MNDLVVAAGAAVACGVAALGVPTLIARVPEPAPDPEREAEPEDPKLRYLDIAALPGLAWKAALAAVLAGGLVGWRLGWTWDLLLILPLVPAGVALAVIDAKTKLLPVRIVLPMTALAIVSALVVWGVTQDPDDLVRGAIGLVVARSVFWLLWWIHSAGMGFGDVRLAALLGFCLAHVGWSEFAVGMYAGFLIFGLPGLLLALVRWDRSFLKTLFPFGPFLLIGALLGVLVGQSLLGGLGYA